MSNLDLFTSSIATEQEMALATSTGGRVTMRTVSPVLYENSVLIFTSPASVKYNQLRENPNCAFKVGGFYAEAKAEFLGATMLDKNAGLRAVYEAKFNGAFAEGIEYGGREAEFILLKPRKISGWVFDNNEPVKEFTYEAG